MRQILEVDLLRLISFFSSEDQPCGPQARDLKDALGVLCLLIGNIVRWNWCKWGRDGDKLPEDTCPMPKVRPSQPSLVSCFTFLIR